MPPRPDLERRAQLLGQLSDIFWSEGFLHLRVGTLAGRLRCSRSTLYQLAESKEALIVLVVERRIDAAIAEACAYAETTEAPLDRLARFFHVIAVRQEEGSEAFWRDVMEFPPTAARFEEARATGVHKIQEYLDQGITQGSLRPANSRFLAHIIWLAAMATRDPEILREARINSAGAVLEVAALIIRGMEASHREGAGC